MHHRHYYNHQQHARNQIDHFSCTFKLNFLSVDVSDRIPCFSFCVLRSRFSLYSLHQAEADCIAVNWSHSFIALFTF